MSDRPIDVPDGALAIHYTAENHKSGTYYLWEQKFKREPSVWHWQALGRDGTEESAYEATQAAHNWIRDGVSSLGIRSEQSEV